MSKQGETIPSADRQLASNSPVTVGGMAASHSGVTALSRVNMQCLVVWHRPHRTTLRMESTLLLHATLLHATTLVATAIGMVSLSGIAIAVTTS